MFFCLILMAILATLKASVAEEIPLLAIDVGHSRLQPGAISAYGKSEFEFNKALAATIRQVIASQGGRVVDIGGDGNELNLFDRTRKAGNAGASFFLSIHHDSVQPEYLKSWQWRGLKRSYSDHAAGFSLFISRRNSELASSLRCASLIGAALIQKGLRSSQHHAEKIAGESKEWADQANGVYFYDNLAVLKTATMPAVLLEAGVIVNRDEELRLQKPEMRNSIAAAVEKGLRNCGVLK